MVDIRITQGDVESLAEKLGGLEPNLSESERALLLGIVNVAADAIGLSPLASRISRSEPEIVVIVAPPRRSLRDEFVLAFTPGAVAEEDSWAIHFDLGTPPPGHI
jgi:hypothetical protein